MPRTYDTLKSVHRASRFPASANNAEIVAPLLFLVQTSSNATSGVLLSSQGHIQIKKCLPVSQVALLRFCLPVNSSQKCTICRPQSIGSFSYSFTQVSSSSQRVSCVETKASCSRKSEKQHNKQGWPSKPAALLPRAPERAAQKHPSIEITSGSLLLSLGLCTRGIHFIPWEMKGRAGQGAKKLRLCLVGLS